MIKLPRSCAKRVTRGLNIHIEDLFVSSGEGYDIKVNKKAVLKTDSSIHTCTLLASLAFLSMSMFSSLMKWL